MIKKNDGGCLCSLETSTGEQKKQKLVPLEMPWKWRKKKKLDQIIVESDASTIIEKINNKIFLGDLRTHHLYQDIKEWIFGDYSKKVGDHFVIQMSTLHYKGCPKRLGKTNLSLS